MLLFLSTFWTHHIVRPFFTSVSFDVFIAHNYFPETSAIVLTSNPFATEVNGFLAALISDISKGNS